MSDEIITSREAAKILGRGHRWVRYLLERGEIKGTRLSGQWAISRASVDDYKAKMDKGEVQIKRRRNEKESEVDDERN